MNIQQPALHQIMRFLRSTTARLTLSYLVIIMIMSIGFSFVFYNTSSNELGRQMPPPAFYNNLDRDNDFGFHDFFAERVSEGRSHLLKQLVLTNLGVLVGGAGISYYLARRTLEPIEKAMEAQSRFASDASHELRTPLAVIQTENEVALRNKDLTLAKAKSVITSNLEEVTRLKNLAEGLLRLSQEDQIEVEPVSLQSITTEAINHVVKLAQAKSVKIDDKVPDIMAVGEAQSLAQAAAVLLDNAIKYSEPGSTVYIEGQAHGKIALLKVRDQGAGISAEDLPHIFDRFYRADQARTKLVSDGYGLGLALASKIVQQQNGEISVKSTPKKGSTFTISLPLV